MITVLEWILNAVRDLPYLIADFVVMVFNAIIEAIAALANFLIGLLPSFPEHPEPPGGIVGFLLWIFPLGAVLAGFAILLAAWVAFLGIRTALRWVKVI